MKKICEYLFIIISLVLIFVNTGCNTKSVNETMVPELIQAENVMFSHPDSALSILQSMPIPSPKKDKENNALWSLLVTQAKYKQVIKISSDSLIKVAYDYYKTTDKARRRAMSALYMGSVNYDLGNIEEAIRFYLEAKTEMDKTEDYQLGYLVMSGLGSIYLYRSFNQYALEAYMKAYDYAIKDNNKRYQMSALKYLARCYCASKEYQKAKHMYQRCSKIAIEIGLEHDKFYSSLQIELALIYYKCGQFNESMKMVKPYMASAQALLLIGKNYIALNKLDSAFVYLEKGLNTDNIYTRKSIYETLYGLSKNLKYQERMTNYCDSLLYYNDYIISLDKGKEIIAYREKYNNEKLISEKRKLELEKANVVNWWMLTIVITFSLILILIFVYMRKKILVHKQEEKLADLALQLHEKELEIDKNQSYITEIQLQSEEINKKNGLLFELEEMLCKLKKDNEQLCLEKNLLCEKISSYSISSYEVTNIKILSDKLYQLEKRENELCTMLLAQNTLIHNLHLKPIYLNDVALKAICKIADDIFSNFTKRLLKDVPTLSEHDIILCCLIKLHFSIQEISIFFNVVPSSVSRSKLRIKNKIYLELGEKSKNKGLDIWIWEY